MQDNSCESLTHTHNNGAGEEAMQQFGKRTIHSFTSLTQMSEIIASLGRIGNAGGKKAFTVEKASYRAGGKQVYLLQWEVDVWVAYLQKLFTRTTHDAGSVFVLPDHHEIDRTENVLHGMVRGMVYMMGGTK